MSTGSPVSPTGSGCTPPGWPPSSGRRPAANGIGPTNEGSAAIEVPDDLAAALAGDAQARAAFEGLSRQNRYAVLYRIGQARRPETRARRIERFVEMLRRGETPHP
jgi:uncharacterized protein YdeI (YjbR/CyaY-like superfamily)